MTDLTQTDRQVRAAVYAAFADCEIPLASRIAAHLSMTSADVQLALGRLANAHVVVLQPDTSEVSMALPFSAVPTPFRVESGARGWYANCAWDAFGIGAALQCDIRFTTVCPDCDAPITCRVESGRLAEQSGVAHFLVPAAKWWDDIRFT